MGLTEDRRMAESEENISAVSSSVLVHVRIVFSEALMCVFYRLFCCLEKVKTEQDADLS